MEKDTITPEERAEEFLRPVVAGMANSGKGLGRGKGRSSENSKRGLAQILTDMTGKFFGRHIVEKWLHPNPERRVEPGLGNGLALRAAWEKMTSTKTKNRKSKR